MTFYEFLKSGMLIFIATVISGATFYGFMVAANQTKRFDRGAPARVVVGGKPTQLLNNPFTYDGRTWQTFWHRLAAEPYSDNKTCVIKVTIVGDIEHAQTSEYALQLMNTAQSQKYVRKDWDAQKDALVMKALEEFFKQNPEALQQLKATGSQPIVVHIGDAHWGTGLDGQGANKLGKLLEEIRSK